MGRNVVLGVNSAIWKRLANHASLAKSPPIAIGHRDLRTFAFSPDDTVWVLSYSKLHQENIELLDYLAGLNLRAIVYLTSSSTIVTKVTRCFRYPLTKYLAETHARRFANAKIVTIGLVYMTETELPAGSNIATSYHELAQFISAAEWPAQGVDKRLFRIVERNFGSSVEKLLYRLYGSLQQLCGSQACLLRPFDLLLKLLGMRWYGYTYLSNRLWISTIS